MYGSVITATSFLGIPLCLKVTVRVHYRNGTRLNPFCFMIWLTYTRIRSSQSFPPSTCRAMFPVSFAFDSARFCLGSYTHVRFAVSTGIRRFCPESVKPSERAAVQGADDNRTRGKSPPPRWINPCRRRRQRRTTLHTGGQSKNR